MRLPGSRERVHLRRCKLKVLRPRRGERHTQTRNRECSFLEAIHRRLSTQGLGGGVQPSDLELRLMGLRLRFRGTRKFNHEARMYRVRRITGIDRLHILRHRSRLRTRTCILRRSSWSRI